MKSAKVWQRRNWVWGKGIKSFISKENKCCLVTCMIPFMHTAKKSESIVFSSSSLPKNPMSSRISNALDQIEMAQKTSWWDGKHSGLTGHPEKKLCGICELSLLERVTMCKQQRSLWDKDLVFICATTYPHYIQIKRKVGTAASGLNLGLMPSSVYETL